MLTSSTTIKLNPDVISQELDGETVLLHLKTEEYYTLDKTGTRIWQYLGEHDDLNVLTAKMLEEYEVDEKTLESDITRLVNELQAKELVHVN